MKQNEFNFDHELSLVSAENAEQRKFSKCDPIFLTSLSMMAESSKPKDASPQVSEPSSLQYEYPTLSYASPSSLGLTTTSPKESPSGTQIGAKQTVSTTPSRPFLRAVLSNEDRPSHLESFIYYFPNAMAAIAKLNVQGNIQHYGNADNVLWKYNVSNNHAGKLLNHLLDHGTVDTDGVRHSTKVAWRALALLETELVEAGATPGRSRVE